MKLSIWNLNIFGWNYHVMLWPPSLSNLNFKWIWELKIHIFKLKICSCAKYIENNIKFIFIFKHAFHHSQELLHPNWRIFYHFFKYIHNTYFLNLRSPNSIHFVWQYFIWLQDYSKQDKRSLLCQALFNQILFYN